MKMNITFLNVPASIAQLVCNRLSPRLDSDQLVLIRVPSSSQNIPWLYISELTQSSLPAQGWLQSPPQTLLTSPWSPPSAAGWRRRWCSDRRRGRYSWRSWRLPGKLSPLPSRSSWLSWTWRQSQRPCGCQHWRTWHQHWTHPLSSRHGFWFRP